MESNKNLLVGLVALTGLGALVYALSKSSSSEAAAHPKFIIGDHITGNIPNPLNVVYVVVDYEPGASTAIQGR